MAGDLESVSTPLTSMIGPPAAEDEVDRATVRQLTDALALSSGVGAVADATASAYRHRASAATGWPLTRGLRRFRPDPLRRLHLTEGPAAEKTPDEPRSYSTELVPRTSLPEADAAQKSAVSLAVRAVSSRAAAPLPDVWEPALTTAARSRAADLSDALDRAIGTTDLGLAKSPLWWRAVGALHWVFLAAATFGLGWLIFGYVLRILGLPELDDPAVGIVPLPTVLLVGGLLLGVLLWLLMRPAVEWGARRARRRAEQRLRTSVNEVGREYVVRARTRSAECLCASA